jgi:serine/threonine protein kinase, bacterial
LVARATARDPADRYADAIEMGAELAAIAEELALPDFRVPAPRNSAQHRSAALHRSRMSQRPAAAAPVRNPTRQLPREPEPQEYEYQPAPGEFAGIAMSEFAWARQHARRMVLVWVAVVLALTGLVATVGWTIGTNLSGLL